jgi:hypothetical protein
VDLVATVVPRPCFEAAAVERGALAHAHQFEARVAVGRRSGSVGEM